jgi:hypothetical protein
MPKPRALLVNPLVTDFKLYDEWMHPLGLYLLGSLLRHNDWEVRLLDCLAAGRVPTPKKYSTGDFLSRVLPKPDVYAAVPRHFKCYGCDEQLLRDRLRTAKPLDAVFVGSGMTYWLEGLARTCAVIREELPDTPVVVGGVAANLTPEATKRTCPGAEVFDGSLMSNERTLPCGLARDAWTPDLRPTYELLDRPMHGPVLLSLGCSMRCSYCASARLQPRCVRRDPELVFEETALLHWRYDVHDFAFYDDALLAEAETSLVPFLEHVIRRGLAVRFHTPNGLHLRYATPELLALMRRAGFRTLRFGYESTSPALEGHTGRKASREHAELAVTAARGAGYTSRDIGVYVMGGLPGQTPEQMCTDMRFVGSLGAMAKPVFLSPIPGTVVFESLVKAHPGLATDPRLHNDTFFTCSLPAWGWSAMKAMQGEAQRIAARLAQHDTPGGSS